LRLIVSGVPNIPECMTSLLPGSDITCAVFN
jgi:hypothetical protein